VDLFVAREIERERERERERYCNTHEREKLPFIFWRPETSLTLGEPPLEDPFFWAVL